MCERCDREGKTKIISFQRCGRWETREFCEHTYKRARLNSRQTGHRPGRYGDKITRAPALGPRRTYTLEQDAFILANYNTKKTRNQHLMQKMAAMFAEKFAIPTTSNMLIGRYHRLKRAHVVQQVRGTPSLPHLKFMEGFDV